MKRQLTQLSIILLLAFAQSAAAQVARVFLAGSGNDANDCSNIDTPCRSLQAAVDQCPLHGEVIIISSGGFGTISKSVTVDTAPGVLAFNARSITASDTVTLRGLVMNGTVFGDLTGISFSSAGTLNVENSEIGGFANYAIFQGGSGSTLRLRNCNVHNSQIGVYSLPPSAGLATMTVEHSRFHDMRNIALWAYARTTATIVDTVFLNNATAVAAYSGMSSAKSVITLDPCMISGNTSYGLLASGTNSGIATIYVSNSAITSNTNALGAQTGTGGTASVVSFGNNSVSNNTFTAPFTSTSPTS